MIPRKRFVRLALLTLGVSVAGGLDARASKTLNFDNESYFSTPVEDPIHPGYGGFLWNNFYLMDSQREPNTGYGNAAMSGPHIAWNGSGDPAYITSVGSIPFTLNSAYLTAAWKDDLSVRVDAFLDGALVDTRTVVLNQSGPSLINFDWSNIDELKFSSLGGSPNSPFGRNGLQFAMDNMAVTFPSDQTIDPTPPVQPPPVPEPSSILVGVISIAAGVRIFRRGNPA